MGIESFIKRQKKRILSENRIGIISSITRDLYDQDFCNVDVERTPKKDSDKILPTELRFNITARQHQERRLMVGKEVKWNLLGKVIRTTLEKKVFRS